MAVPIYQMRKFVAPEFIFGVGSRHRFGHYARNLSGRRVLIVTGPGVIAAGWLSDVEADLHAFSIETTVTLALESSGLDPSLLELELTESILIQDTERVLTTEMRLKHMGVKLSIDDFGSGYSSLAYLKSFKVDKLKIDQSFIRGLATDPENAAIVRAIVHMARSLGLRTTAEGVEDERTLHHLHLYHCDEAQGYYLFRPLSIAKFVSTYRQLPVSP